MRRATRRGLGSHEKETQKQPEICEKDRTDGGGDILYFEEPRTPTHPFLIPCENDMQLCLGLPQVRGHSNYSII